MVFEVKNAFIATTAGDVTPKGPPPFDAYDLVDGYVDTGSWLGWTYVENAPWAYVVDLSKWVYVNDTSGWIYLPN
jgi:hypothetical protein